MKRRTFSRLTIRARLTLVYGGLFLLAGIVLLGVTYALVARRTPGSGVLTHTKEPLPAPSASGGGPPIDGGKPTFTQIAEDTWHTALDALLTQGGIALILVSAAVIGFGWLLAGRLLQPLQQVTDTARRIADAPAADRGLHERIALSGPHDEIKQLADTFDVMLERLDHAFDSQRHFIANASHELRTPLTVNRALLEVALYRTPATPELQHLGHTLLEINARHERLLDGLLLLARSQRDVVEHSYVDLADIIEHVAAQTPPDNVTIRTQAQEAPTTGNPALLERLVQNLVDNAVRYNIAEDGWVHITSGTRPDGTAVLQVSNTGPVIPKYEIPGIFEPFRRLGHERPASTSPGAGLGLSIVQAITRAHGGDLLAKPRLGGGLSITVTLPAASSAHEDAADNTTTQVTPDDYPPAAPAS